MLFSVLARPSLRPGRAIRASVVLLASLVGPLACGGSAITGGSSDVEASPEGARGTVPDGSLLDARRDREKISDAGADAAPLDDAGFATDGQGGDATVAEDSASLPDGTLADGPVLDGPTFTDALTVTDAPLWDGGAPTILASPASPVSLALDETYVYWGDKGGSVNECPVGGCPDAGATTLVNDVGYELAVSQSTLFFVEPYGAGIYSCASVGCSLTPTLYSTAMPFAMVADATRLYYETDVAIDSCPVGAACAKSSTLVTFASNTRAYPSVTATDVFFYDATYPVPTIASVPIAGGKAKTVCSSPPPNFLPSSLVAAGTFVYLTGFNAFPYYVVNVIYQCPAAGGPTSEFAKDVAPASLATDGENLYWTNDVAGGAVMACAVGATCTSPRTVAPNQHKPLAVAVDSTTVVWATPKAILSAHK